MGLSDIIIFPIYVLFFALIYHVRRKRMDDPILKKYYWRGFWVKIASTIAFIIFSAFIAKGDSMYLYYPEGINIAKLIVKDFSNIQLLYSPGKDFDPNLLADSYNRGYFDSESNYLIVRLVAILSFVTFGSYSAITLIFSMISFAGVWRLFKFFYEQYPQLHKRLAIAIIYLPTFVFWSSGILKDPLCTGMIGFLTYALYGIFIKRDHIVKYSLLALLAAYILGVVKLYILVSYLPLLISYFLMRYIKSIQAAFTKIVAAIIILVIGVFSIFLLKNQLKEQMGDFAIDKIAGTVKSQQTNFENIASLAESSFSLGVAFDGTPLSLLKIAPAAIAATLFRPYLWESKKISTLLTSLESLALMLFGLYVLFKVGPFRIFGSIVKDPMILFCFSFAILFALFIGATTLNFGTLVRYKVPCIPFYIIALVLILERSVKKNVPLSTPLSSD